MNYIDLLLYLKQIQQNQQLIHHYKYHYYNDKEWKFLYNGKATQAIPKDAKEIWVSVNVTYTNRTDVKDYLQFEFIFGLGGNNITDAKDRNYPGVYFYDINNYVLFLLKYYPKSSSNTKAVEFVADNSWFKGVYNGISFTPQYEMTIWYR